MVAGERFCDEYCKYPDTYEGDEEKLHDEICSRCPVSELLKLGL